jgi:hypothetical protein
MKTAHIRAASVVAVLAAFPPPSAAETMGVIAVAEPPGPPPELAELAHQLRSVVAERTRGVLEASELRERMTGQISTASLAELDRAYAGALATYQNGDFEGAIRTLKAVIEDLERLPCGPETFAQWTRAMLRLARAEGTIGRKAEARATLERLVRTAPNVKADPNQYPPSFEKQIDDVRAQLRQQPRRKLAVTSTKRNAKVYVDGRDVGSAPVTVELVPGKYRVSGSLAALHVPGIVVDLSEEDQAVELNFSLAEALRPSFGPGLALPEVDRPRSLVTAGASLGVDKLLAARFQKESDVTYLVGTLYDVRRGMLMREGRVRLAGKSAPAGSLSGLAGFLITGQASDLVAAMTTTPQPTPQPTAPSKARQKSATSDLSVRAPSADRTIPGPVETTTTGTGGSKALGWTAFGAGTLAIVFGGVAVVEGFAAKGKYNDANALTNPDGTLNTGANRVTYFQSIADGNSARTVAYATAGGAAACAVTAGILGYLSYKQTGEVGPFRF